MRTALAAPLIGALLTLTACTPQDPSTVAEPAASATSKAPDSARSSAPTMPARVPAGAAQAQVTRVVDGDTIHVKIGNRTVTLRLIGMDTPETKDPRKPVECFGREASLRATELLKDGTVWVESDPSQDSIDRYGRTLGYVWLRDGTLYNELMIQDGFAHEYTYDSAYKYQARFKAALESAKDNDRGFWAADACGGDTSGPAAGARQSPPTKTPRNPPTKAAPSTG